MGIVMKEDVICEDMKIVYFVKEDNMKTKYFEIDGRKFKLEQKREDAYWLTMREQIGTRWEGDRLVPTYCDTCYPFIGKTAYADAIAEILSYSEIDQAYFAD